MLVSTILIMAAVFDIMKSKVGIAVYKLLLSVYRSMASFFKYVW